MHIPECYGCGKAFDAEVVEGQYTPHVKCPHCGREMVTGKIQSFEVHAGNRHFYGDKSRSNAQGCHTSEVRLLKKLVGPALESCVLSDGTVKFRNRQQERAYVAALEDARAKNAAKPGCFLNERAQAKLAARRAAEKIAPGRLRYAGAK